MILLMTGASGAFGRGMVRALANCAEIEKIYAMGRRNAFDFSSSKIEFVRADITEEITIPDQP